MGLDDYESYCGLPGPEGFGPPGRTAQPVAGGHPNGRGVLVRLLRCGVDGTDKEINAGEYGAAPDGYDFLTIGHENFGRVEAVGPNVTEFAPGDYVVATVRRRGTSIYDQIGTYDMTTDEVYFERGVSRRHGYMTEYYVDDPEYIVKVPDGLRDIAVLAEPLSVSEKGIIQAFEIQRRLKVWQPRRAAVLGAGTIGLMAALILRLKGIEVTAFGRTPAPYLNSDLLEAIGARYVSTQDVSLIDAAATVRAVRSDLRGHRLRADRLRGDAGAGQERRPGAGERHGRQPDGRGAGGQDQSRVRARKQGHGRDRERQPRVLRSRDARSRAGAGAVSRAGPSAC